MAKLFKCSCGRRWVRYVGDGPSLCCKLPMTPVDDGELKKLMAGRLDDVHYASARFVGISHTRDVDNVSLGIGSLNDVQDTSDYWARLSPGDAGVFVVDAKTCATRCFGGYAETENVSGEAAQ
jgi:hypothetical protein